MPQNLAAYTMDENTTVLCHKNGAAGSIADLQSDAVPW